MIKNIIVIMLIVGFGALFFNSIGAWVYAWEDEDFRMEAKKFFITFGVIELLLFVAFIVAIGAKFINCCCR